MLHTCVQRFDVTKNLEKFCKILETKQATSQHPFQLRPPCIYTTVCPSGNHQHETVRCATLFFGHSVTVNNCGCWIQRASGCACMYAPCHGRAQGCIAPVREPATSYSSSASNCRNFCTLYCILHENPSEIWNDTRLQHSAISIIHRLHRYWLFKIGWCWSW